MNLEQQTRSQIAGLEQRIHFAYTDLTLTDQKIEKNEAELKTIAKELKQLRPLLKGYEDVGVKKSAF